MDLPSSENQSLSDFLAALDENSREHFEERAAILEYMAGYSREEAERRAWDEVKRRIERGEK